MISVLAAPVSTRIGPSGLPRMRQAHVGTRVAIPMLRASTRKLDSSSMSIMEWNSARQLLHIRAAQEGTVSEEELYGREFLISRPLLQAIESEEPVVLLIDEIDRADDEFEAFLLEVLSDFQITIPEIGTIAAD